MKTGTSPDGEGRRDAQGQIIVIFALALLTMIAMVALVIEAGNIFGQQRIAQNGADATATAGTLVVAEGLGGATRTGADVANAVNAAAAANGLAVSVAEYTTDTGVPIGQQVVSNGSIPADARGVHVAGTRLVDTVLARLPPISIDQVPANADATAVAGALSGECVESESGCALLPVTFPVQVFQCDSGGNLLDGPWVGAPPPGNEGDPYWEIVGAEDLPGGSVGGVTGNLSKMAILPLCRGSGLSSGTFGWLDLVSGMNLAQEITGPLTDPVDIPDWFQSQTGNANSVEDELNAYLHETVLIPLHNQACREDPGDTDVCSLPGVDPVGNNTWYYVHTLANFYLEQVLVQGNNINQCAAAPGSPIPPSTAGGFLGCLKGWFVSYITAGPVTPGGTITPGVTTIGIQLIK